MANFTKFLQLLKKDPVADANDTFNIQTMLNENWDKIDEFCVDVAHIVTGSYVGTGTYGESTPNSIPVTPNTQMVVVYSVHENGESVVDRYCMFMFRGGLSYVLAVANNPVVVGNITTWAEDSVSWFGQSIAHQLNISARTYNYIRFEK